MIGCTCRTRRGPSLECMYPNECECLQDSGNGQDKKRHAYHNTTSKRGCLVPQFLESRFHIYECNSKCDCSQYCKNRVVQYGRKIKVELFKTRDRGFGLRTLEPLLAGQFVDTYRGEIITHEVAEARNQGRHPDEDNYLFDFDKFTSNDNEDDDNDADDADDTEGPAESTPLYVCDGKYMGGPTRFMNHSCEPNCRLFTASYNHADTNLYELAFFTIRNLPAGAELTFDYLDADIDDGGTDDDVDDDDDNDHDHDHDHDEDNVDDEDDIVVNSTKNNKNKTPKKTKKKSQWIITDEMAKQHELEKGYAPSKCRCGSRKCRGYFFFSSSSSSSS